MAFSTIYNNMKECRQDQYHCLGYDCITKEWLCDGFRDCHFGDDEQTGCGKYYNLLFKN